MNKAVSNRRAFARSYITQETILTNIRKLQEEEQDDIKISDESPNQLEEDLIKKKTRLGSFCEKNVLQQTR